MSSSMPLRRTDIIVHDACLSHRFIRHSDLSGIVERPERLRAVKAGFAAAVARLEESLASQQPPIPKSESNGDDLVQALDKLSINVDDTEPHLDIPVSFIQTAAKVDLLNNQAVKFVHGDIEGDVYLEKLCRLVEQSTSVIEGGGSEIPEGLSQGDLYLCPGSLEAISGALGAVSLAVDRVVDASTSPTPSTSTQSFVAIRPPGHHCGEDTPSGFCWVNNVIVGAAHAHISHGITHVVILDIDLHHGNGTQNLVWGINEEAYRATLEEEHAEEEGQKKGKKSEGLKCYYGSLHDVLSYPCEDGKLDLIQAASVSLHGPHGQYIENVHLQPYTSEDDFWSRLYTPYKGILDRAAAFLETPTGHVNPDQVLVFISCGFDASEHEYESMSRHGRKVPTAFYSRFAKDACAFADKYAKGKVISVLEGGYSNRALASGAMAHLMGLVGVEEDNAWWSVDNLTKLEKAAFKRKRGAKVSIGTAADKWLDRTLSLLSTIDPSYVLPSTPAPPTSTRTLRERKTPAPSPAPLSKPPTSAKASPTKHNIVPRSRSASPVKAVAAALEVPLPSHVVLETNGNRQEPLPVPPATGKKVLPKVILRVKPPVNELASTTQTLLPDPTRAPSGP